MTFDEIIKFNLNIFKESIIETPTNENTRFDYIKSKDKKFHTCSKDEVERFLTKIQDQIYS